MREPLGDLGLPVGGPAVDTGPLLVVDRLVGVDRFVAHPAPPAIALGHIMEKAHPSKLAPWAATPCTRATEESPVGGHGPVGSIPEGAGSGPRAPPAAAAGGPFLYAGTVHRFSTRAGLPRLRR
ncbi:hypothetical protein GCM10010342_45090 [Streptomyces anulatus]|nr:hypothetical protein GCM10010342_45090 [Streptomyces anulatus]